MENFEQQKQLKSMPCESTERPIAELEKEGWKYDWSFHINIPEQWNQACERVKRLKADGFWETVLVQNQNEADRQDGVVYIYKRKTDKYKQYEKDMR